MRKKIVAGNWKMNLSWSEANVLFQSLATTEKTDVEVIVFPSTPYILPLQQQNQSVVKIGAQNAYPKASGAYTGETSFDQLKTTGIEHVLIGHSERREYFNESNEFLKEKVDACLRAEMTPVFCCGEPLSIREAGNEKSFVTAQIKESLFHLDKASIEKCIIAYEPIWAIGTGLTASSSQAEEMHATIRTFIAQQYGQETAEKISILYGGSCNENNARELFSNPNVDGGLVGGASLKSDSFKQIIKSF
jgi:triosephosphate isomerase (TIM)